MEKFYELDGVFYDGSTEAFGRFKTEAEAVDKAREMQKVYGEELAMFNLRTILKDSYQERR